MADHETVVSDYIRFRGEIFAGATYFIAASMINALAITFIGGHIATGSSLDFVGSWKAGVAIQDGSSALSTVFGTFAVAVSIMGIIAISRKDAQEMDGMTLALIDSMRPAMYVLSLGASTSVSLATLPRVVHSGGGGILLSLAMLTNAEVIASVVVISAMAALSAYSLATYRRVSSVANIVSAEQLRIRWARFATENPGIYPPTLESQELAKLHSERYASRGPKLFRVLLVGTSRWLAIVGFIAFGIYRFVDPKFDVKEWVGFGATMIFFAMAGWGIVSAITAIKRYPGSVRLLASVSLVVFGWFPVMLFGIVVWGLIVTNSISNSMLTFPIAVFAAVLVVGACEYGGLFELGGGCSWINWWRMKAIVDVAESLSKNSSWGPNADQDQSSLSRF